MDAVYGKPGYLFRRIQQIAVAIFVEECKAYDLTPVTICLPGGDPEPSGIDATRLSAVIASTARRSAMSSNGWKPSAM